MAIIRYPGFSDLVNPWREMERLRREMDRLFSGFTAGPMGLTMGSGVFPALNVSEDAEKYYVQAEIPGIKSEDLEISVEGATLTLSGERKPDNPEDASYHRRERRAGKFHKAITLSSDINPEGVTAECKNGVLNLVLPKAEHAKPKKISVTTD